MRKTNVYLYYPQAVRASSIVTVRVANDGSHRVIKGGHALTANCDYRRVRPAGQLETTFWPAEHQWLSLFEFCVHVSSTAAPMFRASC